jgi:benzoyl-CoA reductase/2-hydroxyglutaryl-CoA dehydratase subunit BcrC/BadD/HgdB
MLQVLEQDDFARENIVPQGGIKKAASPILIVFEKLSRKASGMLPNPHPELGDIVAIDGSLITATLSMHWAGYRKGSKKAKIHLGFDLNHAIPSKIFFTDGKGAERPLSKEKLGIALDYFNRSSQLLKDIYDLAKTKPSPVDNKLLRDFGTVMILIMGTQQGVDICQAFKDELNHRIETGQHHASKERIRLMWIQNRIQYPFPIDGMLSDLGAKIVVDELNDVTWEPMDPDKPFESIAKRMISIPYSMSTSERIRHMQDLARAYGIDGAINPCHWGCRQGTGARGLISKGLRDINVPVLNLEIDCVDSRNLGKGQIETRVEAFIEMLS